MANEMATILDSYGRPIEQRLSYKDSQTAWQRIFGDGGEMSSAGEMIGPREALSVMTWFACVRNISEDIAKLPIKVRRPKSPRGSEEVRGHPISMVARYPNDEMDSFSFWQSIIGHALTQPGGFAEIGFDGAGRVSKLHLLDPSTITVIRNRLGEIAYRVRGLPENQALRARYVLHIHGLGYDGISGYSLTALAAQMLGAAIAMQKYRGSFFGNGANPSGVLTHPGSLSLEAAERLRADFMRRYSGGQNANAVLLLEEGLDWKPISIDPDKSQMVEGYALNVEEICRAFRMPPHKVGHNKGVNYATAEQGNQEYHTDTLTPWTRRIISQMEFKMLSDAERQAGLYVDIVLNALMRADTKTRDEHYKTHFYMGAMSVNDILELEDRDLIDGGDRYFMQRNLIPAERVDEVIDSETDKGAAPPDAGDDQPNPGPMPDESRHWEAYQALLEERIQRVLDIEIDQIRRAQDMESFYSRFATKAQRQVAPMFTVLAGVVRSGMAESRAQAFAIEHCAASQRDIEAGDVSGWSNGTRAKAEASAIVNEFLQELEPCSTAA